MWRDNIPYTVSLYYYPQVILFSIHTVCFCKILNIYMYTKNSKSQLVEPSRQSSEKHLESIPNLSPSGWRPLELPVWLQPPFWRRPTLSQCLAALGCSYWRTLSGSSFISWSLFQSPISLRSGRTPCISSLSVSDPGWRYLGPQARKSHFNAKCN